MFDDPSKRLSSSDALFVDVIHTAGGPVAIEDALGHADFYPNGGAASQPGCHRKDQLPLDTRCSHQVAAKLFVQSIRDKGKFRAT